MSSRSREELLAGLRQLHDDAGRLRASPEAIGLSIAARKMERHIRQIRELILTSVGMIDA